MPMLGKTIAGDMPGQQMPQYAANFGAPANYFEGNQLMIPGAPQGMALMPGQGMGQTPIANLLQMLMQDPQAMAEMMQRMGMR